MAFCVWYADGKMNFFQKFTMYFMMCVPHAAVHGYPLPETIVLSVLFGLPFAFLQKKRDIASAMVSHGIVDAVRFTLMEILRNTDRAFFSLNEHPSGNHYTCKFHISE